jgi:hypothetical protein
MAPFTLAPLSQPLISAILTAESAASDQHTPILYFACLLVLIDKLFNNPSLPDQMNGHPWQCPTTNFASGADVSTNRTAVDHPKPIPVHLTLSSASAEPELSALPAQDPFNQHG